MNVSYLPHTNNSIGDQNEKDDERLDESCNLFLTLFKPINSSIALYRSKL